jgi:hypothetical protein
MHRTKGRVPISIQLEQPKLSVRAESPYGEFAQSSTLAHSLNQALSPESNRMRALGVLSYLLCRTSLVIVVTPYANPLHLAGIQPGNRQTAGRDHAAVLHRKGEPECWETNLWVKLQVSICISMLEMKALND